jgi:hypothetical protein
MLVDHFINFKGCTRHQQPAVEDGTIGMKEFTDERVELLQQLPQFEDPDFAQVNRLPVEARLPDDLTMRFRMSGENSVGPAVAHDDGGMEGVPSSHRIHVHRWR